MLSALTLLLVCSQGASQTDWNENAALAVYSGIPQGKKGTVAIPISEGEANTITQAVIDGDQKLTETLLKAKPYLIYAQTSYITDSDPRPKHDPLIRCVGIGTGPSDYDTPEAEVVRREKRRAAAMQQMVDLLLKHGASLEGRNSDSGRTVLFEAATSDALHCGGMLKFLVERKANVNARDYSGKPVIVACVQRLQRLPLPGDLLERLETLIKGHADVNQKERATGRAALSWAVECKNAAFIKLLATNGADINTRDKGGATPLFVATGQSGAPDAEIARQLVSLGANVNVADDLGNTPLHNVYSVELARLLLKAGAKKNVKNRAGKTPLDSAIERGNKELIYELSKTQ